MLDFEERVLKSQLTLRLSGDNFRRRVIVEGSDDGREWSTLTDEAWVFAIPGPEPARHETVALPENDFPLLRVTVIPGSGERGRLLIEDAWLRGGERPPRREETLVPRWSRVDELESRETWLVLDLGARHQPFQAVVLAVADERFHREATLEVREDVVLSPTDSVAPPVRWNAVGRGVVYRLEHEGEVRESLRLDAPGRARAIRVRLHNRDDRPLDIEDVSVRVPVERLLFEAGGEGGFRLTYGAADLAAPEYDLARSLDPEAEAAWADLGPPARRDVVADVLPWSERHPALLWLGLLVVVAGLGALTWRSLRSV